MRSIYFVLLFALSSCRGYYWYNDVTNNIDNLRSKIFVTKQDMLLDDSKNYSNFRSSIYGDSYLKVPLIEHITINNIFDKIIRKGSLVRINRVFISSKPVYSPIIPSTAQVTGLCCEVVTIGNNTKFLMGLPTNSEYLIPFGNLGHEQPTHIQSSLLKEKATNKPLQFTLSPEVWNNPNQRVYLPTND